MRKPVFAICEQQRRRSACAGPDPGFLDQGFKLAEGGSICAV